MGLNDARRGTSFLFPFAFCILSNISKFHICFEGTTVHEDFKDWAKQAQLMPDTSIGPKVCVLSLSLHDFFLHASFLITCFHLWAIPRACDDNQNRPKQRIWCCLGPGYMSFFPSMFSFFTNVFLVIVHPFHL